MNTPLRVTHLADAADRLGVAAGSGTLRHIGGGADAAIGTAITLHQRPGNGKARHGELAALAAPGQILVIAVDGANQGATWGEAHTLRAALRGIAGLLTDGAIRDHDALRAGGFPVTFGATTPFRSARRLETVAVDAPVTIAGVRIRSGDTIGMDGDGFVCLPQERAAEIIALAREISTGEGERDTAIRAGGGA